MNIDLFFNIFGLFLCHFVMFCSGVTKIWKYDTNINNPENWILEEDPEECEGLIFPSTVSGLAYLSSLDVKEIVLPNDGDIFLLDDADLEINADSTDKLNCVLLNSTKYGGISWPDQTNWRIKDSEINPAIPHQELIPCEHDDVIFPFETGSVQIYYSTGRLKVKSLKIGDDMWTNEDLKLYHNSDEISKMFSGWTSLDEMFDITGRGCEDPTGCICGNVETNQAVCWHGNYYYTEEHPCLDPITPVGFCGEICGAYILFKPKRSFKIDTIRELLKSYSSYSHASKVEQDMIEYIQVVFTETEFRGSSVYDASDLHQKLLNEPNLGAKNVKLTSSQVKPSKTSTVGIVFGSMFGVFAVFGLIFLIYSPRTQELIRTTLENRLNLPMRSSRSTFTTQFMAKYRKDEDSGPFVDSQSMRGSVVSLEKSFENPLFGKVTPSTSSTSYDPNITPEIVKSESEMENPLFDAHRLEELRDIAENGDLVDLSESNTNVP